MQILTDYVHTELIVKNSRFLSELFPCSKQEEARNIIKAQKTKYFDSTHVVHGFMLGLSGEIMGMSDDGEPSGTAGRPVLDVIKGRNCTNIVLTVTRWFGGTLLGTGGLVKAYGDAAKIVLDKAIEEEKIQEYVKKNDFSFQTDYSLHQVIKHAAEQFNISELNEEFGTDVTVSGKIVSSEFKAFSEMLKNISGGKILLNC